MEKILFFDTEVRDQDGIVMAFGAIRDNGDQIRTASAAQFAAFARGEACCCGHNILEHDLKYVGTLLREACPGYTAIDTLPLSPLLFPKKPYHHLLKDDKLQTAEMNNPLNDAIKARELFEDECAAFRQLPEALQGIYAALLGSQDRFAGFLTWMGAVPSEHPEEDIRRLFRDRLCLHADLGEMIRTTPVELAYALALLEANDLESITPPWVIRQYPRVENVMSLLRGTPCAEGCPYCAGRLDVRKRLKDIFGFERFRVYEGAPLQEEAARAAVEGKSLLAVFPTGGGKSLTFQLPALIAGETNRGLTVVISPLQSLMKDQVDHLEERGITDAVAINGLLDPIARKAAIDRVANGMASILYISPESLRSRTIEYLLQSRNVVRFVIDEAHCFSAWGQDFRVDYMYIGDFIRKLQESKHREQAIPVSCFTATAKQKVIMDIRDYFQKKLGIELELFTTRATRQNLRYAVLYKENDEEKYLEIRNLLQARKCPSIIYVSRVRRTRELAEKLREDGFAAEPYNGRLEANEKIRIQNDFIADRVQVIVATSAFGMGVDKKDVGLVIHYDISDSLENYVQEAGRAGRDEAMQAECYVLFNEEDLDKHFILLNQTKLSISEIQQVWSAVKAMTRTREITSCSALEIARQAGWDEAKDQIETRVTSALAALENAGYLERGRNVPHIYASSIMVPNMAEASARLQRSRRFTEQQKEHARRVMSYLLSRKNTVQALSEEAESRVDYLADRIGISREEVVDSVLLMREEGLLADAMDMTAVIHRGDHENRTEQLLKRYLRLEAFLISHLAGENQMISYRELNDQAIQAGIRTATVRQIRTLVFLWTLYGEYRKHFQADEERSRLERAVTEEAQIRRFQRRRELTLFIVEYLYRKSGKAGTAGDQTMVTFSLKELQESFNHPTDRLAPTFEARMEDLQQALIYLTKVQAMTLEGGFLVSYNAMQIHRLRKGSHTRYRNEDYRMLQEFYQQRIQQIHIVGEYAHLMVRNYEEALGFVSDYFRMDYRAFLAKYFRGNRQQEINRNITAEKYERLFGSLSPVQQEIINDDQAGQIVVAAGPGSGKTRLLVHKLASLMMMGDVKHDQLLMLTFSRAAATEFKQRLLALIGNAAHFVEIKTFHGYCFDLLGKMGNPEDMSMVVQMATELIRRGEAEPGRVTKTALVIDEAQDMDAQEYELVCSLRECNENLRIIAVGDDDQNIYAFRGSNSAYMLSFLKEEKSRLYEMTVNYRSRPEIVALANAFAQTLRHRVKTQAIEAFCRERGRAEIIRYSTGPLELPVLERVRDSWTEGTLCVLTWRNDEAARMQGLFRREGIPTTLIQSSDGFSLLQMAEIRYFLERLKTEDAPAILNERWEQAKEALRKHYAGSTRLELCERALNAFESVNRHKYRSDLREFLRESNAQDFLESREGRVVISTIHKAKGREFDHVHLVLRDVDLGSEENRRAVYVGLTRARKTLTVHSCVPFLEGTAVEGLIRTQNEKSYGEPEEILLQMSHRDVVLSFFDGRQGTIRGMRCGDALIMDGESTLRTGDGSAAVRLSAAGRKRLQEMRQKGYEVTRAEVRFQVWWKDREEREILILLPDLLLRKQ